MPEGQSNYRAQTALRKAATTNGLKAMANGELTCLFWDVQHGSAAYINTPANEHLVIDLGVGSYQQANLQFSPLLHLKHHYGVQQLDGVVITHPHRDHLDDIGNFDALSPRVLVRPKRSYSPRVEGCCRWSTATPTRPSAPSHSKGR